MLKRDPSRFGCITPARVDRIDVAQLLHAIGEASANDSSTALFGLLLSAQEVLAQVQHESGGSHG